MWAGSRVYFADRLRVGDTVERLSTVRDVVGKRGGSGQLCFVTVEHVFRTGRGEAVREEQDLVYRERPKPSAEAARSPEERKLPAAEPPGPAMRVRTSPVLLFRYSALTFNGHRIHYDQPYSTEVEGYRGLVVHGPLQATLLLNLAADRRDGIPPRSFAFQAKRPLVESGEVELNIILLDESSARLWTGPDEALPFVLATARW
jgi:3-methylfumaryl-CoA hydratase